MIDSRSRLALAAAAVLLLAGCSGDDPTAAEPTDPPVTASPAETPNPVTPSPDAPEPAIDPCLIGRWHQDTMSQQWTVDGELVEVDGWTGRILEFTDDGTEIVTYDDATPLEAASADGPIVQSWSGVAVYEVSTSGDVLTFESVDFSDTVVTWQHGDEEGTYQPDDVPSPPVTYTCDDTTHTQHHTTYEASFTRLD
jgi:hypothetical protein